MKQYTFEYQNNKFALNLFLISFFALIIQVLLIFIFLDKQFAFIGIIFSLLFPILIFYFNRKKIKKIGFAQLYNSSVEFNLNNTQTKINFNEISSYFIQSYNGTTLHIKYNSKKIGIVSNSNFCKTYEFDSFCEDLQKTLEEYKNEYNIDLKRKKTFFEQKWIYVFLIITTSTFILFSIFVMFTKKHIPLTPFLITLGPLLTLWSGYYNAKNKN